MFHTRVTRGSVLFISLIAFGLLGASFAYADGDRDNRAVRERVDREALYLERVQDHICNRVERLQDRFPEFNIPIPEFCPGFVPDPPTVDLEVDPTEIEEGESATLSWNSQNADTCTASNGWVGDRPVQGDLEVTPTETTTYELTCENAGGADNDSATVVVTAPLPPPPPDDVHVLITEVFYDVDNAHGEEGAHEWVELYNPTDAIVDLSGWTITDSGSQDVIPGTTFIGAHNFLVLTASSTLEDFWVVPDGVPVVNLDGSIGNGLGNGGDALTLADTDDTPVDALSWGTDISVFDPAVPDVVEGHSLARDPLEADTDTAADWVDRDVPTPGS